MIYLDNAATTFPKPECVYQALSKAQREFSFNIGRGAYRIAQNSMKFYDELKKELCLLVGLTYSNEKVILSSSATMAANQLIYGLDLKPSDVVYYSPFEHNAIARPLEQLRTKIGFEMVQIPYNKDQELLLREYKHLLAVKPATHVFACYVSNVTGLIQDIRTIFELAGEVAIKVTDVSQAIGLVPIDMVAMSIDYLIFAGHKTLYGPFGIGGIIRSTIKELKPVFFGGTGSDSLNLMYQGTEVGSPNAPAIFGLLAGVRWIKEQGVSNILNKEQELIEYCIEKLELIYGVKIFLPKEPNRRTGIIAFNHMDYTPSEIAEMLDVEHDICVRSGYHCAPYISNIIGEVVGEGTVRISISLFNTKEEIDQAIRAIDEVTMI